MANEYIYIPGKGTVRHYGNINSEPQVVGEEFRPRETVKAQVKAPQEVVYDVRPKDDEPEAERPPVIVELAKSVDIPVDDPKPVKESKNKKAEKKNTESKD